MAASSDRRLSEAALRPHAGLVGRPLASPLRRLTAMAIDMALLIVPSVAIAALVAGAFLWRSDPEALRALRDVLSSPRVPPAEMVTKLAKVAPLLVRVGAEGAPPSVAVAVENGDVAQAGSILSNYDFIVQLGAGGKALPPRTIQLKTTDLVPNALRGAAMFGVSAVYFTLLGSGRRSTLGKRVCGIEVIKLDGEPLSFWEAFERFGGYLASVGTFGLGLLDLWKEPNRRAAHDRTAGTVVLRRA